MRLEGWSRLGIVISALYGVFVFFIAYDDRPRLEQLQSEWIGEACEVIAEAISKEEGKEFQAYEIREAFFKGKKTEEVISWFEKIAASPTKPQEIYSKAIRRVNEKHKLLIAALHELQIKHWIIALAWWGGGTLFLFGTGWTIRWVYRGFRQNAAE